MPHRDPLLAARVRLAQLRERAGVSAREPRSLEEAMNAIARLERAEQQEQQTIADELCEDEGNGVVVAVGDAEPWSARPLRERVVVVASLGLSVALGLGLVVLEATR